MSISDDVGPGVPCRLTGLRYTPLTDESTFSALMRFAWFNAFNRREVADYCIGPGKAVPNFANFDTPKWLRSEVLIRSIGWNLPNSVELLIHRKFRTMLGRVFTVNRLKFCPLCMEGLYHTTWFQLENLQCCPVHNCGLLATCMSCGAPSPPYSFAREVFDNPYFCTTCKKPFCGAHPSIDAHELIRREEVSFEHAFADYRAWLERLDMELFFLLWPEHECYGWHEWCDINSIQAHFLNLVSEIPQEIAPHPRSDLIELYWRTHMYRDDPFDCRGSSIYENGDEMNLVLRVFLRCILPWAFSGVSTAEQNKIKERYLDDESTNPQCYDEKQLAYLIVECSHRWGFGPRMGQLGGMKSWCNRVPKVAYCAYLYGLYAGIYHSLRRERRRGATTWAHRGKFRVSDYLIAMCSIGREVHSGRIIFPEVPGMPMLLQFGRDEPIDS